MAWLESSVMKLWAVLLHYFTSTAWALAVTDWAERKALNHAVDAQPPIVRMNPLQQSLPALVRQTTWSILILVVAGVLLAGCGSASARVRGVAPLNLNDNNESTPVDVRFFQLADDGAFRRVTFDALWVDAGKALGGDLLGAPVVKTVFPGSRSDQPTLIQLGKLSGKTKFIGVMGLYRRTDGTDRRTLVLALDRIEKDVIELSGYSVALSTEGTPAEGGKGASNPPAAPTKTASGGG